MDYFTVPATGGPVGVTPVSTSTTSAQTAALTAGDYVCVCSALTYVKRGPNPTAVTTDLPIPPNYPVILRGIQEQDKLAFIVPTGTGTASVCRQP